MERNRYESKYSAMGYDAVARKKIKELEKAVGGGGGGGRKNVIHSVYDPVTDGETFYLGSFVDGDHVIITKDDLKELVDTYGFVSLQYLAENGGYSSREIIHSYEMVDGEVTSFNVYSMDSSYQLTI